MGYKNFHKNPPLTEEEIKERYEEAKEELGEVMEWKKETEENLADDSISPQKKGAAKRAMKKIERRIDTVNGNIIYWKLRTEGMSHFRAGIERSEYWEKCKKEKLEKD